MKLVVDIEEKYAKAIPHLMDHLKTRDVNEVIGHALRSDTILEMIASYRMQDIDNLLSDVTYSVMPELMTAVEREFGVETPPYAAPNRKGGVKN